MEKLWMCRICLVEDVQMHLISETHLQTIYEALTCRPFETEDNRPIFTCYICHAHLQNAYQLKLRCLRSEKVFTQMLINKTIAPENRLIIKRLEIVHPVLQLNLPGTNEEGEDFIGDGIPDLCVDVKIEHENPEEIEDITIEENEIRPDITNKETEFDIDLTAEINSVSPEQSLKRTDLHNDLIIEQENMDMELNLIENYIKTDLVTEKDDGIKYADFGIDTTSEGSSITLELSSKRTDLDNGLINVEENKDIELNRVENELEIEAFIENDLIIVEQNVDIDLNFVENGMDTDAAIEKDSQITVVSLEKDVHDANSTRTGLTLEENDLRTHISPQDNCERTIVNVGQCNIRTGITQPSRELSLCPKDLRVVLERITLTNIKTGVSKKPGPTMQKENKENTKTNNKKKTVHKQTKKHTKMNSVNAIKSIIKNKTNKIEKQIKKRVSFSDTDKENILQVTPYQKPKKEKPFICDICKNCFTLKDTLRIHIRTHTQEKAYKCDKCVKSFHHQSAYVMHYRTHTGDKPFRCDVCQKRFHRKVCLDRHAVIHFGLKPFKCNECGRGFNFPHNLNQHLLTHSGERPNKCTVCGKGFIEKRSLIMHSRLHTDDKPYKCDICKKYYPSSEKLLQHFKIHSEKSPMKCEICKIHFICEKNFKKHVLRKHETKLRKKA